MGRRSHYAEKKPLIIEELARQSHHGRAPTMREVASSIGVGVATLHSYLAQMAQEGLVEWQPKTHRSVRLTPQARGRVSRSSGQSHP